MTPRDCGAEMHSNPAFRGMESTRNLAFAREQSFGVLCVANGQNAPMISHVPFLLSDDCTSADLHLARPNPIVRALDGDKAATIVISGPHGYISPDWYQTPDQVPTWNYVTVHLAGRLERLSQNVMRDMLDRQSAWFESRLHPKQPWTAAKMTDGLMDRMMRAIVPFRLHISHVDGTWKLGQNKDDAARLGAADGVEQAGESALARLMRDPVQRAED